MAQDLPQVIIAVLQVIIDVPQVIIAVPQVIIDVPQVIIAVPQVIIDVPQVIITPHMCPLREGGREGGRRLIVERDVVRETDTYTHMRRGVAV